MKTKFYYCESCGNLLVAAIDSGVTPVCCGEEMTLLQPNTVEASNEKHMPVVTYTSAHSMRVNIGADPHPMTSQHHIRFVCLQTTCGFAIHYLNDGDAPEVCIRFSGKPIAIYAYCNIHGLWCAKLPPCYPN